MDTNRDTSVIFKVSEKAQNFINSPKSLFLFPGIIFIFGIFNLIGYGFFGVEIYSPWINNSTNTVVSTDPNAWIGWLGISISMLGGTIAMIGTLLIIRLDKRFIIPVLIGETLIIFDAIIAGYVFTGLSYLIMAVSAIYIWWSWNSESDDEDSTKSTMNWIWWVIILSTTIIYMIVGALISTLSNSPLVDPSEMFTWIDLSCSAFVIASWILMNKKDKSAFIGFISTDILYLVVYFMMGYWATSVYYVVYLMSDTVSMFSWVAKDMNNTQNI